MHRALVIRLGEALEPLTTRVRREYEARDELGCLPDVRVRFLDAPPAGVGNLTNPVQVLRENLEREIASHLTELLRLNPGQSGDLVLDVYLLMNLGEPLVANAARVVCELVDRVVAQNFRTIFPPHRVGTARRFRLIPIAILPAPNDCERGRHDAADELQAFHDALEARADDEKGRRPFPVDRVFLLDAMTVRGIATIHDLMAQAYGFLRLVLFSGLRRSVELVQLLESECNDLFATFGIATCEVDIIAVRRALTERMIREVTRVIATAGDTELPTARALVPEGAVDDPHIRTMATRELDELPLRTLDVEGSGAVLPLRHTYGEVAKWIATLRQQREAVQPHQDATPARESSPTMWMALGAVVLGLIVFAVAHFALLVGIGTSAATGGGFAVFAFALLAITLRDATKDVASSDSAVTPTIDENPLEELDRIVTRRRQQLASLAETLSTIAQSDDRSSEDGDGDAALHAATTFVLPLTTEAFLDLLYEREGTDAEAREIVDRFLASLGTWAEHLQGDVEAQPDDLDEWCAAHFRDIGSTSLFVVSDHRACVRSTLEEFVGIWRDGVPVFLEGESRKQYDPDGFRMPLHNCLIAPAELDADLRELTIASTVSLLGAPSRLDDVFVVSAVIDIHRDAVSPLAD